MTDRETVLANLLSDEPSSMGLRHSRPIIVVPDKVVMHLDYDDPEHVYRLTLTTVPRQHLHVPETNVAEIGGIGIRLTSVEISNHTTVVIDADGGPNYQADMATFHAAYERWEQNAEGPLPPPEWPADKIFGCVRLSDDVATNYTLNNGSSGGSGTEFECTHIFDPAPPSNASNAKYLRVDFVDHHTVVGTITLDL